MCPLLIVFWIDEDRISKCELLQKTPHEIRFLQNGSKPHMEAVSIGFESSVYVCERPSLPFGERTTHIVDIRADANPI